MQFLIIALGILIAAVIGVLVDWIIKLFLPEKPNTRHIFAIFISLIVLIMSYSLLSSNKQINGFATATNTNLVNQDQQTTPTSLTEEANWAVSFVYNFSVPFWTVGMHEYTISVVCPSFPDLRGTWTHTFEVSENAMQYPSAIYLRFVGLRTEPLGTTSTIIYTIHPTQSTVAIFSLTDLTSTKKDKIMAECNVLITWDGGFKNSLIPHDPFKWP